MNSGMLTLRQRYFIIWHSKGDTDDSETQIGNQAAPQEFEKAGSKPEK
jgi:hypothetical protein